MQELSDTIKRLSKRVIAIAEGMKREAGLQDIFNKIIIENSPNMEKDETKHWKYREPQTDSILALTHHHQLP